MDTSMQALTGAIERIGTAFEEFKSTNDSRLKNIEKGDGVSEITEKLGRVETEIKTFSKIKTDIETEQRLFRERIEELESRSNTPGKSAAEKAKDEYKETWEKWIRSRGKDAQCELKMQDLMRKDVTIGTPSAGGYAVPTEIARTIENLEAKYSPVRRLVNVVQTGTSDFKAVVNLRGTDAGWVGETGSRTATNTSSFREVAPTMGEIYAYPKVSDWAADDIFFDVNAFIAAEIADAFARYEGAAVISGSGSNQPTGMLHSSPVATADFASPLRAAAAYQYIACVATNSPAVAEILPDSLIDLQYSLNTIYRANATWVVNSNTAGSIRKMKDANGQYLWQPSLQANQPSQLLGYPVETWEDLDDVGTNKLPVAFGDFKRGYLLTDRIGMRMTVDNVTTVGYTKFYVRRREGGIVLNNDAIKWLKTTLS